MNASNITMFASNHKDLKAAKREWSERLLKPRQPTVARAMMATSGSSPESNVCGVGIGEQITDGKPTGVMAVKFYVHVKFPESQLSKADILPKNISGLPVDVEQSGVFRPFARKAAGPTTGAMPDPKVKLRPAQPGCSIGFQDPKGQFTMAGTFGAVVKSGSTQYILSNNHVLADEGQLAAGAPIFQPGLLDGGNASTDQIAELTKFIPLVTTGNSVDCAIAKVRANNLVSKNVLHIGAPTGVIAAAIDMNVHKFGRTTSYTVGRVASIDTDVTVGYETGNFTFQEQIIIVGTSGVPFSGAGDSGSLIMERSSNKAAALLFAGSSSHTIANHIQDVLQALGVTLA